MGISGYENESGSKNEPKKGAPQHKSAAKKADEEKAKTQDEGEDEQDSDGDAGEDAQEDAEDDVGEDDEQDDEENAEADDAGEEKKTAGSKRKRVSHNPHLNRRGGANECFEHSQTAAEPKASVKKNDKPAPTKK